MSLGLDFDVTSNGQDAEGPATTPEPLPPELRIFVTTSNMGNEFSKLVTFAFRRDSTGAVQIAKSKSRFSPIAFTGSAAYAMVTWQRETCRELAFDRGVESAHAHPKHLY